MTKRISPDNNTVQRLTESTGISAVVIIAAWNQTAQCPTVKTLNRSKALEYVKNVVTSIFTSMSSDKIQFLATLGLAEARH